MIIDQYRFPSGGGGSYLVSVDPENTGTPSGWTDTGSPDWGYSTSPIVGSYSLNLPTGTGNNTRVDFTAQSDVWAFVRMRRDSTPSTDDQNIIYLGAGSTRLAGLTSRASYGGMFVAATAAAAAGGNTTNGVNFAIWIHYVKNTSVDIWIATDGTETRPGSVYASVSGATSTQDATRLYLSGIGGSNTVWDKIRVSDTEIGNDPS